jgi:hypothetical protein
MMRNPAVTLVRVVSLVALALLCAGCASMDFGGKSDRAWEFRWGWNQSGVTVGEEDPDNPGFDREGNLIPENPEVLATYQFPDTTAGYGILVQPTSRTTPTLGLELAEFRTPYLRWFSVQAVVGDDLVGGYLGKRFTSIYEITGGLFYGRDQRINSETWGVAFTLLKF